MILVNSGAFLSISSWFCELTELIFVMIPYISSTGYPPKTQGIMGHVQVANNILFSWGKMAYKWVCLRKFVIELAYVPPVYRSIRKKSNERVTQILDKERGINEQIYFELLYVYSCI